ERQVADRLKIDGADHRAGEQVEHRDVDWIAAIGSAAPRLDAQDRAGDPLSLRLNSHSRTAKLVEEVGQTRVLRDVDLEALERFGERILRWVGHRSHATAVLILKDDRLQDVVDLARLEAQLS